MRATTLLWEDLRANILNYRLLLGLFVFQAVQSFLLETGQGSPPPTESLLQDLFYLASLVGAGFFSVFGSVALLEEEKLGTLPTLFTTPLSLKEYLAAKISFPLLSWLIAWGLVLVNLVVMKRSIGEMPLGQLAAASLALFLCVLSVMLFTILLSTLLRDTRIPILVTFSLIFVYLLFLHSFYLEGMEPGHPVGKIGWFVPFVHADKVWIWVFDRVDYVRITISPAAELVWLAASCLLLLICLNALLLIRYRRSIG